MNPKVKVLKGDLGIYKLGGRLIKAETEKDLAEYVYINYGKNSVEIRKLTERGGFESYPMFLKDDYRKLIGMSPLQKEEQQKDTSSREKTICCKECGAELGHIKNKRIVFAENALDYNKQGLNKTVDLLTDSEGFRKVYPLTCKKCGHYQHYAVPYTDIT